MRKRKKLQLNKNLPLDQCALYKVRSKKRLCKILNIPMPSLRYLIDDDRNYHIVEIEESINELTGKRKRARSASVPNFRLKKAHSRVLYLLSSAATPAYAHGSVKGRSYITNALAHTEAKEVLNMDLKDFFRSVKRHHIYFFFKDKLLCSPDVAGVLSDLLTYKGALPVGSPVSALLAMWVCQNMFNRLDQMASESQLRFTSFVDDLTFSGDSIPRNHSRLVDRICVKYGFSINHDKTVLYENGAPALVTGVIVHEGTIKPPYSRYRNLRKLSTILSQQGRHAIINEKNVRSSFLGGLNEAKLLKRARE